MAISGSPVNDDTGIAVRELERNASSVGLTQESQNFAPIHLRNTSPLSIITRVIANNAVSIHTHDAYLRSTRIRSHSAFS